MNNNNSMMKLKTAIENYKTSSPILVVGDALGLFLKAYKYKTNSISNEEDLIELIDYYSYVEPSTPLVIYDLSILSKKSINKLLKFIEEYSHPLILGSKVDNFDSTLLSRIKTYIRFSKEDINSELLPISKGLKAMEDTQSTDISSIDRTKKLLKYSPQLYYYEKSITTRNKDRILSILGGSE